MLKILNKALIWIKGVKLWGFLKNPLFYFGSISIVLFWGMYASFDNPANFGNFTDSRAVFFNSFFNKANSLSKDSLFSSQASALLLETPDLKIMQDNTLCGVSTPCVVSGKVLGDTFGGSNQNQKEVNEYIVQPGDTLQSIADTNNISVNTLLWANDLTSFSTIKVGQSLTVLPVDGVLHIVKSGDTIFGIAQAYKAKMDDVIAYNDLANQDDIYIGDILIVPGGVIPKKSSPIIINRIPLADNFFIFPVQGRITQGLHYYNAVDIGAKCGSPIFAAAAGVVQRAYNDGGWHQGGGNYITILHSNGVVSYYGHVMTALVRPGDRVYTGQNIALVGGAPGMAGAGKSTGCHVHFDVYFSVNPFAKYPVGTYLKY